MKPLTKPQQELLDAMSAGVTCHYIPYPNAYYYRTDNMRHCTAQAKALLARGLVEKFAKDWRGHQLRIKEVVAP